MIHHSRTFDQTTLEHMMEEDKVVQRYRAFFSLINWEPVLQREAALSTREQPHHPFISYIKALLVKLIEGKEYITELRSYNHTNGYRAQRYRCPLLHPEATGETCNHEQFKKGKECVKDANIEAGGIMRVTLDRTAPLDKTVYTQRTFVVRINSQAKALGIERPKVHNGQSVKNLNTLIYVIINVRALQRAKWINK